MKKQFINTLNPGDSVDDIFVLSKKSLKQKKDGDNYLEVVLADKTGKINAVAWDNIEQIIAATGSSDFVLVKGSVSQYNGKQQLVIKEMAAYASESVQPADFIPTTPRNADSMFDRLVALTRDMKNEYLKKLLDAFWNDEEFVRKFKTAPAAKKMHHAYIGGLLEHTLSMAFLVDRLAGHYSGIDSDLLLTGAILHDIGKIRELEYRVAIDYSDEGRLLSHIVIGCEMVAEKIRNIEGFPQEEAMLLRHMIVSHHGIREFGSPEVPKTIEAVLLNHLDEIDAKVNGIREFIAKEDDGSAWTSYHRMLDRQFYRGKK
jgi:3'-5' exoribonuclease